MRHITSTNCAPRPLTVLFLLLFQQYLVQVVHGQRGLIDETRPHLRGDLHCLSMLVPPGRVPLKIADSFRVVGILVLPSKTPEICRINIIYKQT